MSDNGGKVIFLDAGGWMSRESSENRPAKYPQTKDSSSVCPSLEKKIDEPVMTFGLIERNAIALCSFYAYAGKMPAGDRHGVLAKRLCTPLSAYGTSFKFEGSLIDQFLTIMMEIKYGDKFKPFKELADLKEFHIIKLLFFPDADFLDAGNIMIFIPDLHLHYFKETYLDNFITWYRNDFIVKNKKGYPTVVQLENRVSMENDFGDFAKAVQIFKKRHMRNVKVWTLGDTYEMWETNAVIELFLRPMSQQWSSAQLYQVLDESINWLRGHYHGGGVIKRFLDILIDLKISSRVSDLEIVDRLVELKSMSHSDSSELSISEDQYLYIDGKNGNLRAKANYLKDQILRKYHSRDGTSFYDLFANMGIWAIVGNHDNFLNLTSLEPLQTFGKYFPQDEKDAFPDQPKWSQGNTDYLIIHGNEIDSFNNNKICGFGYLITGIVALFEAVKCGDILKNFEEELRGGDPRADAFRYYFALLKTWKESRNKVIVQAHTHLPCLTDVSNDFIHAAKRWPVTSSDGPTLELDWIFDFKKRLWNYVVEKQKSSQTPSTSSSGTVDPDFLAKTTSYLWTLLCWIIKGPPFFSKLSLAEALGLTPLKVTAAYLSYYKIHIRILAELNATLRKAEPVQEKINEISGNICKYIADTQLVSTEIKSKLVSISKLEITDRDLQTYVDKWNEYLDTYQAVVHYALSVTKDLAEQGRNIETHTPLKLKEIRVLIDKLPVNRDFDEIQKEALKKELGFIELEVARGVRESRIAAEDLVYHLEESLRAVKAIPRLSH